jgi:hypothetical protein
MSRKFVFGGSFSGAVPLLLDLYPATAAYSLRKLRTAYSGSAIRVRRSSDNAEQDIGFVGNDLDTASLLAFVGAGNGFVTTWYNQSSTSGLNVTQSTLAQQPQIVNTGIIELENGKHTIKFGGSTFLNGGNILSVGTSNDMATFAIARTLVTSNSDVFFKGVGGDTTNAYSLTFTSGRTTSFVQNNAGVDVRASVSSILTTQQLYNTEFIRNISNRLLRNNVQVAIRTASVGVIDSTTRQFTVGGLLNTVNNPVRYLNGNIQEIIIIHNPTTPLLSDVNTLINDYYAIY